MVLFVYSNPILRIALWYPYGILHISWCSSYSLHITCLYRSYILMISYLYPYDIFLIFLSYPSLYPYDILLISLWYTSYNLMIIILLISLLCPYSILYISLLYITYILMISFLYPCDILLISLWCPSHIPMISFLYPYILHISLFSSYSILYISLWYPTYILMKSFLYLTDISYSYPPLFFTARARQHWCGCPCILVHKTRRHSTKNISTMILGKSTFTKSFQRMVLLFCCPLWFLSAHVMDDGIGRLGSFPNGLMDNQPSNWGGA